MPIQTFEEGDRVWIEGKLLPNWFNTFPRNKWATVKKEHLGTYALNVDGHGYHAWYPGCCLKRTPRKDNNSVSDVLPTPPKEAHVILHLKGSSEKIDLFYFMWSKLDPDCPWSRENGWSPKLYCGICSGAIYRLPNLTANHLRSLAGQIDALQRISGGLKLKIKKFSVAARCAKDDPEADKDDEVITPAAAVGGLNILDAANEVD